MDNNVKKRLVEFIAYKNMSVRRFEIECGLPNAYVSNMRNNITSRRLEAISTVFPELNIQWLMTGENKMLNNKESDGADNSVSTIEKRLNDVSMRMIDTMNEFVKEESVYAARYRECIDRLQMQCERIQELNVKLMEMLERVLSAYENKTLK